MNNIHDLSATHSIVHRFVAELRSTKVQTDRMRFRRNLERIGEVIAYEISKTFEFKSVQIESPLGVADTVLPLRRIVLGTILRAGLPFHQGLLNYFDDADNAFISAYRSHLHGDAFEIKLDYISAPPLDGCTLILCDPMLATGASVQVALQELQRLGDPSVIHIAAVIASTAGIDHVQKHFPNAHIWAAAIDEELTAKSYIVPGLGDAGDLAFGEKL